MRHSTQAIVDHKPLGAGQPAPAASSDGAQLRLVPRPALHLPVQLTSFVGRARELAMVVELLDSARLLTLTGPGGCGKTRLALRAAEELADSYAEGVWCVELAGLEDAALLPQTVAHTFGLREQPSRPASGILAEYLQPKRMLLVLDNCEHMAAACASLAVTLLRACPHLRILATSREALRIDGERIFLVPPLALSQPPTHFRTAAHAGSEDDARLSLAPTPKRGSAGVGNWQTLTESEAVELFVARASAKAPTFRLTAENAPVVAQICQHLEGLPLAIELATARINVLPVEQLATRLVRDFRLLVGGSRTALPRHQTMYAAIEWSYALLDQDERVLFRRLAVFAGGWTLEAAEAVCGGLGIDSGDVLDLLARLIDKSLVVMIEHGDGARYRMLELVRQYASERLQISSERAAMQRAHAAYILRMLQNADPHINSTARRAWLARLEPDHDNVRAALRWATEIGDAALQLRLASACCSFWGYTGYWNEGRGWLEAALSRDRSMIADCEDLDPSTTPSLQSVIGKALYGVGWLAWWQGDLVPARAWLEQSLAYWRKLDDPDGLGHALFFLGYAVLAQGDVARARLLADECLALARGLGEPWRLGFALVGLGNAARAQGRYAEALACYDQGVVLFRELSEPWPLIVALGELCTLALKQGEYDRAALYCRDSLKLCQGLDDPWSTSRCLDDMATALCRQGDAMGAARLFGAAEALRETIGAAVPEGYRPDYAPAVAQVHVALGPMRAIIWAEGRAMASEQAITFALTPTAERRVPGVECPRSTSAPGTRHPAPGTQYELRIFALGSARVERGGQSLAAADWGYAQPRDLLFYLLGHRERNKEQIGLDFWPDAAPSQLRNNFHRTLHHLRQALGRADWVVRDQANYAFNRGLPYWYDVEVFEAHLHAAHQNESADPIRAIGHLEQAIGLYQGDYLQESAGDWHFPRQRALRERYQGALLLLGKLLSVDGRHAEAAAVFHRAITHDSLLEEAHRGLMRCYARQGERSQALRHYQSLVETLQAEIGADPAPESLALYQRLRSGEAVS